MENASKALLMAGTILISLMVISALVFAYRDLTSEKRQEAENQKVEEIAEFNKSFESYEKDLKGTQIFSLANKITDYNEKYVKDMNEGYEEITLTVTTKDGSNAANYYTTLQTKVDNIMKTYKSSNYLEALQEAYDKKENGKIQEKEQADETIKKIKNKIGNAASNKNQIKTDYNQYDEYKAIKNKTFKSDGITYYSNGRIQSMTYRESH